MRLLVGTSGYSYKEWKGEGLFYPEDLPAKQMLRYYAERFDTVEINNTFYRMPSSRVLAQWSEQTPKHFCFVLKASRRITHQGKLQDVSDSVAYLFEQARTLGPKLGPVLFQLPPYLRKDLGRLEPFVASLPEGVKATMEFRHRSWFDEEVYSVLRSRNVALCISDGEVEGGVPFVATADWGYLRLRGVEYSDAALREWAAQVNGQQWSDAYVFFKHEEEATGPRLAQRFRDCCGRG